jgi:pyruvate dehydrogenase E2 component (dihydrolipoamide acetyltransferase)
MLKVKVPDIGGFNDVPIIELHVKPGDRVKPEDPLITLESDKATMDVPAPAGGIVKELKIKVGDKVSEGSVVLLLEVAAQPAAAAPATPEVTAAARTETPGPRQPAVQAGATVAEGEVCELRPTEAEPTTAPPAIAMPTPAEMLSAHGGVKAHASPSVRRFARDLGVDVAKVGGTGPKGRITQADVQAYVKGAMANLTTTPAAGGVSPPLTLGGAESGQLNLLPWPQVDFAKFGPVDVKPLSRIKKISGPNLARNWVMIPAVTYHEDADISDLEALRVQLNKENERSGIKVTMLAFIIKAVVAALKKYPDLNSSLAGQGGEMSQVFKNYWHIGFAADTPNGLMVPVLKNADQKGVLEIAQETSDLAKKARDGKLGPADMQGATFTVSSLGGIGGTSFSPIVNAPEVAILGVNKSAMKPVWDGKQFVPRLLLPLSLSADHRVVDGALATRFNAYLAQLLTDFRRVNL